MNVLGNLRRAWITMQDGAAALEAAAGAAGVEAPAPLNLIEPAARRAREALAIFRPALEHVENTGDNDNGATPLELARDAETALGRFLYCFEELSKYPRYVEHVTDAPAALEELKAFAREWAELVPMMAKIDELVDAPARKAGR